MLTNAYIFIHILHMLTFFDKSLFLCPIGHRNKDLISSEFKFMLYEEALNSVVLTAITFQMFHFSR